MLGKLYKHEFRALFRGILPIYAALFGFSVLSRLTLFVNSDNTVFNTAKGFIAGGYVLAIVAVFIVALVIVVARFYKNLFTSEGYLTLTLPVTPSNHIICKLICGIAVITLSFIAVFLSLCILGVGTDAMETVLKLLPRMWTELKSYGIPVKIMLLCFEVLLLFLVSAATSLLMFYSAIAIGQQFRNKVGGAAIAYICIYAAVQMLSLILVLPATVTGAEKFNNYINGSVDSVCAFMALIIVYQLILSTAYFLITRYIMTKKINLE